MRRFWIEICKFIALQAVILGACLVTFFGIPNKYHYLAAAEDKQLLLERSPSPRIIIVGDSGAAYGVYSPILKERFPEYHPVNMALMAAVGMPTMLAEVQDDLRPNDIVVLIFAYQHFDRYVPSWEYFNYLAYRPDMLFSKPLREATQMSDMSFFFFHRAIHSLRRAVTIGPHIKRDPPMHRDGFNFYGDLVSHHTMTPVSGLDFSMADMTYSDPEYTSMIVNDINEFTAKATSKGAKVYFLFPAISDFTWEENGEVISQIGAAVTEQLDCAVLNQPSDVIYPTTDFFDTFYHLTGEASKRRTSALADALEQQLLQE